MGSIQSALALQNYQTTSNWYTQTKNAKSSQELNKPYSFNYSTYASSLFSDKVAGSLAQIISSANKLHTSADSFRNSGNTLLNNRVVASADNSAVTATAKNGTALQAIDISVQSIATAQTNSGAAFNPSSPTTMQAGTQTFAINTSNKSTQVSFSVIETDTHQMTLDKMKNAINASDSGLKAKVVKDPINSNLHLELTSKEPGTTHAFVIVDVNGNAVSATGVQSMNTVASNAAYRVNGGSLRTSNSNQIQLDNGQITATLLKPTTHSITLAVKPDSDSILKQTKQLVKEYNELQAQITDAASYVNPAVKRNLNHALKPNDLAILGISNRVDGTLALDESVLNDNIKSHFSQVTRSMNGANGVAAALSKVTDQIRNSPAEALLNQSNSEYKQYNNYQATLQFYTQLPKTGLLLNNFF